MAQRVAFIVVPDTGHFGNEDVRLYPGLHGEQAASSPWQQRLREREPALTVQELEVCAGLLQGMTHLGIAAQLGVKESTIKTYRNRAFDRFGIHFRSELFAMFLAE
nr:helix-turn-helix transcriptional regulator [uncultured Pseudomonas sp.]